MATMKPTHRPVASLAYCCRQLHINQCAQSRAYAVTSTASPYSKVTDFHPGNIFRNHREKLSQFRPLPVPRSPPHIKKTCPDPIAAVTTSQFRTLDPTGQRTRLFSKDNPERIAPGDIVLVRQANGQDPISGAVIAIRRKTPVDTAILLRNQLTRVAVEVWIKIYSPNVTGIELVQRKEKRARRNKLYYYRDAKHDPGNLEGVTRTYLRSRAGLGQKATMTKTKGKKR